MHLLVIKLLYSLFKAQNFWNFEKSFSGFGDIQILVKYDRLLLIIVNPIHYHVARCGPLSAKFQQKLYSKLNNFTSIQAIKVIFSGNRVRW